MRADLRWTVQTGWHCKILEKTLRDCSKLIMGCFFRGEELKAKKETDRVD